MVFQAHSPFFPLDRYIESIFYYEGLSPAHRMDRFLPDGNTELIIDLSENTQYIYDNQTLAEIQVCRRAWASGVRTRPITIPSGRGSKMLVVAFKKGMAYPFYPLPISEITDMVLGAELIFGKDILDLRERLLAVQSFKQMFGLVETFLLRQAGNSFPADIESNCVEYAVSSIMSKPTRACFQQLSDQIGYSQKHFINLFKKQVGMPPGQYMKIIRFQRAIVEIEKAVPIHWSDIALQNGYYDQAHFIHEFKTYSGFTPSEYMIRRTGQLNYVPIH